MNTWVKTTKTETRSRRNRNIQVNWVFTSEELKIRIRKETNGSVSTKRESLLLLLLLLLLCVHVLLIAYTILLEREILKDSSSLVWLSQNYAKATVYVCAGDGNYIDWAICRSQSAVARTPINVKCEQGRRRSNKLIKQKAKKKTKQSRELRAIGSNGKSSGG